MSAKVGDQSRFSRLGRLLAATGVMASGTLIASLLMPEPEARAAAPVRLQVLSQVVQAQTPTGVLAAMAERYLGGSLTLVVAERRLPVRRAALGAEVDLDRLQSQLAQAGDGRSAMRRLHAQLGAARPLALPMPVELVGNAAADLLEQLKDEVDREAREARVDPRRKHITQAHKGMRLDVHASLSRIERAMERGDQQVSLALVEVQPRSRVADLGQLDMSGILADFKTPYSRGQKARNRTHNLRTAAAAIDGQVLQPGQVFDFNQVVGDRTRSNGFRMAPVIAYGKLVDGMGGGTCQIASSLHGAVFFAGLPILTRSPHSRPSHYIRMGLDAAVAYGTLNFRFRNDRPYPVVLGVTVKKGRVHAAVYGPDRHHRVTFMRRVDQALPFPEKVVQDASLPKGVRVLSQRGIPGFKLTNFRVVEDLRTGVARRESHSDSYPPTIQLWRLGTGSHTLEAGEMPPQDSHSEYTADEFLSMSQGPNLRGFKTRSRSGRTGMPGWTETMVARAPSPARP